MSKHDQPGRRWWRPVVGVSIVVVVLAAAACSRSRAEVRGEAAHLPGVERLSVESHPTGLEGLEGPDVHSVRVRMEHGVTTAEVRAVFDVYADDVDDGDVEAVTVVLDGKDATIVTGEGEHVDAFAVDDLVAAASDDRVLTYRREILPVLDSVEVRLVDSPFSDVVARADTYRDAGLDSVGVSAGRSYLVRDGVNEELTRTGARQRYAEQLLTHFRLVGVHVAGRGPLEVLAERQDSDPVRRFVSQHPDPVVGRVVVKVARSR